MHIDNNSQNPFFYHITRSESNNENWEANPATPDSITLDTSKPTHILISDSRIGSLEKAVKYAHSVIDQGFPEHSLEKHTDFYIFYNPNNTTSSNEKIHSENFFQQAINLFMEKCALASIEEYQQRINYGREAKKSLKDLAVKDSNFGCISRKNLNTLLGSQDNSLDSSHENYQEYLQIVNRGVNCKFGLPDPIICWTVNGDGEHAFSNAIQNLNTRQQNTNNKNSANNFYSYKLQHVHLNNCTINVNQLDEHMAKCGIEWCEKGWYRDQASLKNIVIDILYSSEYSLLKRRVEVNKVDESLSNREKRHPYFFTNSSASKVIRLNNIIPIASKSSLRSFSLLMAVVTTLFAFINFHRGTEYPGSFEQYKGMELLSYSTSKAIDYIEYTLANSFISIAILSCMILLIARIQHNGMNNMLYRCKLLYRIRKQGDIHSMPENYANNHESAAYYRYIHGFTG